LGQSLSHLDNADNTLSLPLDGDDSDGNYYYCLLFGFYAIFFVFLTVHLHKIEIIETMK